MIISLINFLLTANSIFIIIRFNNLSHLLFVYNPQYQIRITSFNFLFIDLFIAKSAIEY